MQWKGLLFLIFMIIGQKSNAQSPIERIQEIARQWEIPGIQLVHYKKGKPYSYSIGVKKNGESNPVTAQTLFQAASLTKVVSAYAFFKLMDRGLIDLDTPLYHYYPYNRLSNNVEGQTITARMVLTHHSGLLNWEGAVTTDAWRNSPLTLQFTPGSQYLYSGEGFYFLQCAMEAASGMTFQQLIVATVFEPFGMKHSYMSWNDSLMPYISYGHLQHSMPRALGKYSTVMSAYSLYTTAEDYTLFIQKALNKGIGLTKRSYRLLTSKAADASKADTVSSDDHFVPVTLGMRLQLNEKGKWLWHTGSNPGFRCFFITHPKTGESLAVFMNAETGFSAMPQLMSYFLGKNQTFWAYLWRKGELD